MMNHWAFKCKDITQLISKSMDEKVPLRIRLGIKFHLMMCHLCTRYKKQLELIQKAMKNFENTDASALPAKKLPDDVKEKIKTYLVHPNNRPK
ncbi:MAG: hypothetical protein L3J69_16785 [Desulfobacula sp.]|nr:hypothetical protein [Desulfobacula sp.]